MCNSELYLLIQKYQSGDKSEFEKIFDVFKKLISLYSKRLNCDDTYQELCLFLINLLCIIKLDKFRPDDSIELQKYIAAAIRNRYIALSKQKQQYESVFIDYCEDIAADNVTFEDSIILADTISMLPEKQAKIIIYKYCFQYNDMEIANILHIRRETVNRNKQRALTFIKNYFFGSL